MTNKIKKLQKEYPRIQALAGTGHSALPLLGALSYRLNLPILAVRKTKDTENDSHYVNGFLGAKGYLIIDDLISSGGTVDRIIAKINKESKRFPPYGPSPECVGVLLYSEGTFNRAETIKSRTVRVWGLYNRSLKIPGVKCDTNLDWVYKDPEDTDNYAIF